MASQQRSDAKLPTIWILVLLPVFITVTIDVAIASEVEIVAGPSDQIVMEHSNAVFNCEVLNIDKLQHVYWTREPPFDMFIWDECYAVLEKTARSAGSSSCDPRHSILVVRDGNTIRWRVELVNATLQDDGVTYICNPAGLQASGTLTVMVPPKTLVMDNYRNGARVDFDEIETHRTFLCRASDAKMASNFSIDWYVNGVRQNKSVTQPDGETTGPRELVTYFGSFNLTRDLLVDRGEDTTVECRVDRRNSYVLDTLSSVITIVQTRSPSQPTVNWEVGRTYPVNEMVYWTCETRGGWPEPSVFWYRDDVPIDHSFESSRNSERISTNTMSLRLREEDNQAEFRCEVWNSLDESKKKKVSRVVNITYNPRIFGVWRTSAENPTVPIENQTEPITLGDTVVLRCDVLANPRAFVNFSMAGVEAEADSSDVKLNYNSSTRFIDETRLGSPRGVETSAIKVFVVTNTSARSISFGCVARNGNDRDVVRSTIGPVKIAHPPTSAHIEGEAERIVYEDNRLHLRCVAIDADPPADFNWKIVYSNGTERSIVRGAHATISRGSVDTSELRDVAVHRDMAQSRIVCEVSHRALRGRVLSQSVLLTVRFSVREVSASPKENPIVENSTAEITCSTDFSFPKSQLRWQLGGTNNFWYSVFKTEYFGNDSIGYRVVETIHYEMKYTDDGKTVYCTADTPFLSNQKSHGFQQIVHYSPRIPRIDDRVLNEGQEFVVDVNVRANPRAQYQWRKKGLAFRDKMDGGTIQAVGSRLESSGLTRRDNGTYELEANNTIGRSSASFSLYVRYIDPPAVEISKDKRSIVCQYSADPPPKLWIGLSTVAESSRQFQQMALTSGSFVQTPSSRSTSGRYLCVLENVVGQQRAAVRFTSLRKVMLLKTAPLVTAAVDNENKRAKLRCVADSPTAPTFIWTRNGEVLRGNATLLISSRSLDAETYESTLEIIDADVRDMGLYVCASSNEQGTDSVSIDLVAPRGPDEPQNLTAVESTDTSVTISWNAGFNGGSDQRFVISYREVLNPEVVTHKNPLRLVHHTPESQTEVLQTYTIPGLTPETEYEFSVKSQSKNGETRFIDSVFKRTNAAIPSPTVLTAIDVSAGGQTPLMIITGICIAAMFLLIVNVLLICICVRSKNKKKRRQQIPKKYALNGMEMLNAASPIFDPASAAAPLLNSNQFAASPLHNLVQPIGGANNDMFTSIESVPNGMTPNRMSPPAQLYVPDLNDPHIVELAERMAAPDTMKTYSRLDNSLDGFNDDLYKVYQKVLFHEPVPNGNVHKTINLERSFHRPTPTPDVLNNLDVVHQQNGNASYGTLGRQNGGWQTVAAGSGRHSTAEIPTSTHHISSPTSPITVPTRTSSKQINVNAAKMNGYRQQSAEHETTFGVNGNANRPPSPDLPSPSDEYAYDRKAVPIHSSLPDKRFSRKVRISEGHVV